MLLLIIFKIKKCYTTFCIQNGGINMKYYLVFDIGGFGIKYGIFNSDKLIKNFTTSTPSDQSELKDKILEIVENLTKKYKLISIGISMTGVINVKTGKILFGAGKIKNLEKLDLKNALETKFEIPVFIDNDVNCIGIAEIDRVAKKYKNIVFIALGSGVGGAVFLNRTIIHGKDWIAGEFGMIQHGNYSFGQLCSMNALIHMAKKIHPEIENGHEVFEYFDQNDFEIQKVVDKWYGNIALLITNLSFVFNPDLFIIGGGISSRSTFIAELYSALRTLLPDIFYNKLEVKAATLKNNAGLYGAYALIPEQYKS